MTRKEAIAILQELWRYEKTCKYDYNEIREALTMAIDSLARTGHWLTLLDAVHQKEHYHCTSCRTTFYYDAVPGVTHYYNYCPECGAKMEKR